MSLVGDCQSKIQVLNPQFKIATQFRQAILVINVDVPSVILNPLELTVNIHAVMPDIGNELHINVKYFTQLYLFFFTFSVFVERIYHGKIRILPIEKLQKK